MGEASSLTVESTADAPPEVTKRLGLDWFEWCCLGALTALSLILVARLLVTGRTWTGGEGPVALDQLQYLTWIREAGTHGLIGNRWDFAPDHRVFLHPGFLISGLVWRFTPLSLAASYALIWKPVSILMIFTATRLWTRRLLDGTWPRRIALFIALFVVMPWSGLLKFFGIGSRVHAYLWGLALDFPSGEIWTIQPMQGYAMTAVAIALMTFVLLDTARRRDEPSWARIALLSAGCLMVMWLQPWQGAELLLIIAAVELWRRLRCAVSIQWRLIPLFVAGAIPAVYYSLLASHDAAWKLAGEANKADSQPLWAWPWWVVLMTFVPLAVPALFALRKGTADWGQLAARVWPLACVAVFFQPFGTFPFHAVQGIMIPLAVLIVQGFTTERPGWLAKPAPWLIVLVLAFLSVPGTIHKVWSGLHQISTVAYPYTFAPAEEKALAFLQSYPAAGGVFTDGYGGLVVPAYTGREALLGPFSWTPDFFARQIRVQAVFGNLMHSKDAQSVVIASGARFIFQPCHGMAQRPTRLVRELDPLIESTHDFGCARVYVLKPNPVSDALSKKLGGPDGG
jgi:hypothetical protein